MSDNKNIDRLFQEKFKDFEATPNKNTWSNIQNKLEQKDEKTKRILPVWFRYASIAALLLLFVALGDLYFKSEEDVDPIDNVVDSKTPSIEDDKNIPSTNSGLITNNNDLNPDTNIVSENNDSEFENIDNFISNNNESLKVNESYSSSTNESLKDKTGNTNSNISVNEKVTPANKNKLAEVISSNKSESQYRQEKELAQNTIISNTNNSILNTSEIDKKKVDDELKSVNDKSALALNEKPSNEDISKTNELLEEQNTKEKDSTSLTNEIALTEEIIEKEKELNRWQVYTNIAPVYYNSFGKGSHIDDQFVNNPKSGELNTSYGINVGYAFNEKLTIRSGINKLNLSYDTDNVILYETVSSSPTSNPLRNLDLVNENGQTISAISATNLGVQQITVFLGNYNAALSQRMSYFEVPVELQYGLINNKFGLNVIAGFSTFILNDNEVFSEFDGIKTYIGKANNINNVSFSTNLGLGLGYNFSDKFKWNFEPTLKYQINAYSNTAGNFKPYIIGVYTGFSYKF